MKFRTNRLEGFEVLRAAKVPTPNYQVVRSRKDIESLILPERDYGWTIRTCRYSGLNEFGLFYKNKASVVDVSVILASRLESNSASEFYIVYPSWKFEFSMHILQLEYELIIEGVYGSQKKLAMGHGTPDFSLKFPFGLRSQMITLGGKLEIDVEIRLGRLLGYLRRIPSRSFYAEVAFIHTGEYVFYELRDYPEVVILP